MRLTSHVASGPADGGVIVEPVPPGLASGRFTVPRTVLSAAGAIVIVIGVVYFTVRALTARKKAR